VSVIAAAHYDRCGPARPVMPGKHEEVDDRDE
jgi:hypothetical protein